MFDLSAVFDEYERLFLISSAIVRYSVLKRRVLDQEGYLRVRAELVDGGLYVHRADGQVESAPSLPDLETVLREIERHMGINS